MATQKEILDAIKVSMRPYSNATHRRIAENLCVRIDRVSRTAMELAEQIDAFQQGNPPADAPSPIMQATPREPEPNPMLDEIKAMTAEILEIRQLNEQFRKNGESTSFHKAINTVEKITPELLTKVGMGDDRHFGGDRKL